MRVAIDVSGEHKVTMELTRRMLSDLADNPLVKDLDIPACKRMFDSFFMKRPFMMYANLGIIDLDGRLVCSVIGSESPVHLADREYFQETVRSKRFTVGKFQIGRVSGKKTIAFGYPVLDVQNNLKAVCFAALDLDWLKIQADFSHIPKGSSLTLLDGNGTIIYRYPDPLVWEGRAVPEKEIVKTVMSKGEGVTESRGVDGIEKYYGFQRLGHTPGAGYVYVGLPKAEILSQANATLVRNLVLLGIAAFAGMIASWFFAYVSIMKILKTIVKASKQIASGDLSARTRIGPDKGEFGELGAVFDFMAQSLEDREVERKKSRQDLLREKTFTDNAIDSLPGMFYLIDRNGCFMRWNENFERVSGYDSDEISKMKVLDFFQGDDMNRVDDRVRDVFLNGEASVEAYFVSKSGSATPYYFTGRRVILDESECLVGMGLDITERRRSEEVILESESRYRLLTDNSLTGIYIHQEGLFVYVNDRMAEMVGCVPEDMIGKPFWDFVDPADRDVVRKRGLERSRGLNKFPEYEFRLLRKDGAKRWAHVLASTIVYNGRTANMGNIADVTDRKSLQEQLLQAQKMEAVGTLAGGIAHDFNNMLAVIQGYSELLLFDRQEGTKEFKAINAIRTSAERGADLVRAILAFSRKIETNLRPVDLNHEVEQARKLLSRTIPKMISVDVSLDDALKTISADPVQIEQVILNLALNAQHAISGNRGRILIETRNVVLDEYYCRTHVDLSPGHHVLLAVSDNGHGMEKEVLDHIFEPFFTTKDVGEGTGLGLAMVYGIVLGHKGHIECYSEVGAGTTFKIYFPIIDSESQFETKAPEMVACSGSETVMIVDDEPYLTELGENLLSAAGYKIITAVNGKEAVEIYKEKKDEISLILLDLAMPTMGGKECLTKLVEIDPDVKVIIASGYSAEATRLELGGTGIKGFIEKPFNLNQMLLTIRQVLDQ